MVSAEIPTDIIKFIQASISKVPVVVIGSGASAAYGIAGMWQLAKYLQENICPYEDEVQSWTEFTKLLNKDIDLESALHQVSLSERLETEIVRKTKELILSKDVEIRKKIVLDEVDMSLGKLIRYFSSTANPKIKIVTTNYDRLIEYAVNKVGVEFSLGFSGTYIQRFNGTIDTRKLSNKVEILKVHGSLDWYSNAHGEIFVLPDDFKEIDELTPVMVTPGKSKYLRTHNDPFRTVISRVDNIFVEASSILIIGFGFNDEHIQPKLMQKMRSSQTPIIIISKTLTDKAQEFIKTNHDSKIIGIEECGGGSKLVFPDKEDLIIEPSIWGLDEFMRLII